MRLLLIGIVGVLCLTEVLLAAETHAQILDRKITVEVTDGSITQAFHTLEAEHIYIAFDDSELRLSEKKVSAKQFKHSPVRDVLSYIVEGTGLTFREAGAYITLEKKVPQRPGRISGKVYNERGLPLAGANIRILETNQTAQSGIDGAYQLELPVGSYRMDISYISYQTQRVEDIRVRAGQNTSLDIAMKINTQQIEDVVITVNYKQASVAGLYAAQKNAASVTDGISAEQIARTPDNNVGEVLKRVTGVTTVNNSRVIVRGMSTRYNQAMVDGVTVPSTSLNHRDFSFDIIPAQLVSSVVVNKTATPDLSSEFSGGQISVNTMDIPDENFTNIQLGTGGNGQTVGQDFYRLGGRHTGAYFGLDNQQANAQLPEGILSWNFYGDDPPPGTGNVPDDLHLTGENSPFYTALDAIEQSQRFSSDNLRPMRYKGVLNQNYVFSMGRVYNLHNDLRFGFSASASLRNEQQIMPFNNVRGSNYGGGVHYIDSVGLGQNGAGTMYRFRSNSGLVANLGLQGTKFKLALKNMYTNSYTDTYYETIALNYEDVTVAPSMQQFQQPLYMSLQQHQLSGEYQLPWEIKFDGMFAYNRIQQRITDERKLAYRLTTQIGDEAYFQTANVSTPANTGGTNEYDYRMWTAANEQDFNWALNFSRSFGHGNKLSTLVKAGYQGWAKRRDMSVTRMITYAARNSVIEIPYYIALDPPNMGSGVNEVYYWAENVNGPVFDGGIDIHAVYLMADQKFWNKLRLVYGLRGESFMLDNNQEGLLGNQFVDEELTEPEILEFRRGVNENGWSWLPSLNATYEITSTFNVRGAYSRTAIRPDFRESSFFGFYDPELDGTITGDRVESTMIDNVDFRLEWYPSPGEIVSLTAFYKYLDRPIELVRNIAAGSNQFTYANMESAVNRGLELEIRKNLSFLGNKDWLQDMFIYGNGSLIASRVSTLSAWAYNILPDGSGNSDYRQTEGGDQNRPLVGQSPWLVNVGFGYWGEQFGLTASYNQRGYRTNLTDTDPRTVEYEQAAPQLDAQVYARFLKKKQLEVRLNLANMLNQWTIFYTNIAGYENSATDENGTAYYPVVNGTSDAYSATDGDVISYRRKEGQRFNLSLTYSF